MKTEDTLKLIQDAHSNAVKHGFYEGVEDNAETRKRFIMLIISEVAEFMEADRKGKWLFNGETDAVDELSHMTNGAVRMTDFVDYYKQNVKGCAEEELADICIRCFDMSGWLNVDFFDVELITDFVKKCAGETVPSLCFVLCSELTDTASDVTIRLKHVVQGIVWWCRANSVALDLHIRAKMLYNKSRAYKHCKNY